MAKIKYQATRKLPSLFRRTTGNTIIFSSRPIPEEGINYEYSVDTATPGQTTLTKTYIINNVLIDNIPQTTNISGRNTNTITFSPPLSGGEEIFAST